MPQQLVPCRIWAAGGTGTMGSQTLALMRLLPGQPLAQPPLHSKFGVPHPWQGGGPGATSPVEHPQEELSPGRMALTVS